MHLRKNERIICLRPHVRVSQPLAQDNDLSSLKYICPELAIKRGNFALIYFLQIIYNATTR